MGCLLRFYSERRPLLVHTGGWRRGGQEQSYPVWTGFEAAGDRNDRNLFTGARGRSERMFRKHQERLPKELALAGIDLMGAANRYVREVQYAGF